GDDVALLAAELTQHGIVGDVAQALADDLLRGERGDATEVVGRGLLLADHGAGVVLHGHVDADMTGLAVELRASPLRDLTRLGDVLSVGGEDRLLDDPHELVERDLLLTLDGAQQPEIDVHSGLPIQLSSASGSPISLRRYRTARARRL